MVWDSWGGSITPGSEPFLPEIYGAAGGREDRLSGSVRDDFTVINRHSNTHTRISSQRYRIQLQKARLSISAAWGFYPASVNLEPISENLYEPGEKLGCNGAMYANLWHYLDSTGKCIRGTLLETASMYEIYIRSCLIEKEVPFPRASLQDDAISQRQYHRINCA